VLIGAHSKRPWQTLSERRLHYWRRRAFIPRQEIFDTDGRWIGRRIVRVLHVRHGGYLLEE